MDNESSSESADGYTVIARRYRPQTFAGLIGQDHISQALSRAISGGRVGHAYLFTGARGVGKTSTARIFAKELNAPQDGSAADNEDIARAIEAGDDMDVIEIDGASNRGIEEIRQLRANVHSRPSRSPYKIYIIDEVHMLTTAAFNALLKTLEEPPSHVKFIFCTTDPEKLPITVLSRCQRFDFAPVKFEAIQQRLAEISEAEGFSAEPEALALLARKAAGSMRDSQSLLEQVMSFSEKEITAERVHSILGTANETHLHELSQALFRKDPLMAIQLAEQAVLAGADTGQLAEQLLNYLRDLMAVGLGGDAELLKLANPAGHAELKNLAEQWGTQSLLSAIQILDETLVRMRQSVSADTLFEVALVQICQLQHLASIPALLEQLTGLSNSQGSEKKKAEPTTLGNTPAAATFAPTRGEGLPASASSASADGSSLSTKPSPAVQSGSGVYNSAADPAKAKTASPTIGRESPPSPIASPTQTNEPAKSGHRQLPTEVSASAATTESVDATESAKSIPSRPRSGPATRPALPPNGPSPSALPPEHGAAISPSPAQATDAAKLPRGPLDQWQRAVSGIEGMLSDFAHMAIAVEPKGSDAWNVIFPPGAIKPREYCEVSERRSKLQQALESTLGREIYLTFSVQPGEPPRAVVRAPQSTVRAQKMREAAQHPLIQKLKETVDAEIIRVDAAAPNAVREPMLHKHRQTDS